MAKGLDKHRARQDALSLLGKTLARRSRRRCELCEEAGVRLDPSEVEPLPEEPALEQAILLCERCAGGANHGRLGDTNQWRFLDGVVWSDVPPVQVTAVRLLRAVAATGADWATALDETLYLADDIAAWIDGGAPELGDDEE